jgi:hypothetical protein
LGRTLNTPRTTANSGRERFRFDGSFVPRPPFVSYDQILTNGPLRNVLGFPVPEIFANPALQSTIARYFSPKGADRMSKTPSVGAFAIVPSNDLPAAIPFWERLGFARTGGDANYIILTGWGCEVHLTQAGTGPWRVPEDNNPFGVYIRTPDVDAIAARAEDLIIRPGGVLRHREWGLYEVGMCGPDGLLVRIGWPSRLIKGE